MCIRDMFMSLVKFSVSGSVSFVSSSSNSKSTPSAGSTAVSLTTLMIFIHALLSLVKVHSATCHGSKSMLAGLPAVCGFVLPIGSPALNPVIS